MQDADDFTSQALRIFVSFSFSFLCSLEWPLTGVIDIWTAIALLSLLNVLGSKVDIGSSIKASSHQACKKKEHKKKKSKEIQQKKYMTHEYRMTLVQFLQSYPSSYILFDSHRN